MDYIPVISSLSDFDNAVKYARENPSTRWYVERMAKIFKVDVGWDEDAVTASVATDEDADIEVIDYDESAEEQSEFDPIEIIRMLASDEISTEDAVDALSFDPDESEIALSAAAILADTNRLEEDVFEAVTSALVANLGPLTAAVRKVRTPAGAKRFKQPIGSVIFRKTFIRKGSSMASGLKSGMVFDYKGKKYQVDDKPRQIGTAGKGGVVFVAFDPENPDARPKQFSVPNTQTFDIYDAVDSDSPQAKKKATLRRGKKKEPSSEGDIVSNLMKGTDEGLAEHARRSDVMTDKWREARKNAPATPAPKKDDKPKESVKYYVAEKGGGFTSDPKQAKKDKNGNPISQGDETQAKRAANAMADRVGRMSDTELSGHADRLERRLADMDADDPGRPAAKRQLDTVNDEIDKRLPDTPDETPDEPEADGPGDYKPRDYESDADVRNDYREMYNEEAGHWGITRAVNERIWDVMRYDIEDWPEMLDRLIDLDPRAKDMNDSLTDIRDRVGKYLDTKHNRRRATPAAKKAEAPKPAPKPDPDGDEMPANHPASVLENLAEEMGGAESGVPATAQAELGRIADKYAVPDVDRSALAGDLADWRKKWGNRTPTATNDAVDELIDAGPDRKSAGDPEEDAAAELYDKLSPAHKKAVDGLDPDGTNTYWGARGDGDDHVDAMRKVSAAKPKKSLLKENAEAIDADAATDRANIEKIKDALYDGGYTVDEDESIRDLKRRASELATKPFLGKGTDPGDVYDALLEMRASKKSGTDREQAVARKGTPVTDPADLKKGDTVWAMQPSHTSGGHLVKQKVTQTGKDKKGAWAVIEEPGGSLRGIRHYADDLKTYNVRRNNGDINEMAERKAAPAGDASAPTPTPTPSSPSAPSAGFTRGRQAKLGDIDASAKAGDPEHTIPKRSFADGTTPAVGTRVVDKDGREGTVAKTYQAYSAVKWDDGKSKVVSNNSLNSSSSDTPDTTPAVTPDAPTSSAPAPAPAPAADTSGSSAFVKARPVQLGEIDASLKAGDPGHTTPKRSFADGVTPAVGQKVRTADGRTGTVIRTYQAFTAVEWDDGGRKVVGNGTLNVTDRASTPEAPAAPAAPEAPSAPTPAAPAAPSASAKPVSKDMREWGAKAQRLLDTIAPDTGYNTDRGWQTIPGQHKNSVNDFLRALSRAKTLDAQQKAIADFRKTGAYRELQTQVSRPSGRTNAQATRNGATAQQFLREMRELSGGTAPAAPAAPAPARTAPAMPPRAVPATPPSAPGRDIPIARLPVGSRVRVADGRGGYVERAVGVPVVNGPGDVSGKYRDSTGAWDYVTPDTTFDVTYIPPNKKVPPAMRQFDNEGKLLPARGRRTRSAPVGGGSSDGTLEASRARVANTAAEAARVIDASNAIQGIRFTSQTGTSRSLGQIRNRAVDGELATAVRYLGYAADETGDDRSQSIAVARKAINVALNSKALNAAQRTKLLNILAALQNG